MFTHLYKEGMTIVFVSKAILFVSCLEMMVEKQAVPTEIYGGLVKDDEDGNDGPSGDI